MTTPVGSARSMNIEDESAVLVGIARRERSRAPMQTLGVAEVTTESGVANDASGEPGDRQVTVITEESWRAACAALDRELPWTMRRANLLIRGIELRGSIGARLQVGDVVLQVTEENPPCFVMDRQYKGLRAALEPELRAGVACRVITSGRISVGSPVVLTLS
ncbi:MAG: MOSC domain-containing protein [Candidatus Binataceae bacterium]